MDWISRRWAESITKEVGGSVASAGPAVARPVSSSMRKHVVVAQKNFSMNIGELLLVFFFITPWISEVG
jgi:hypothetical protein